MFLLDCAHRWQQAAVRVDLTLLNVLGCALVHIRTSNILMLRVGVPLRLHIMAILWFPDIILLSFLVSKSR